MVSGGESVMTGRLDRPSRLLNREREIRKKGVLEGGLRGCVDRVY